MKERDKLKAKSIAKGALVLPAALADAVIATVTSTVGATVGAVVGAIDGGKYATKKYGGATSLTDSLSRVKALRAEYIYSNDTKAKKIKKRTKNALRVAPAVLMGAIEGALRGVGGAYEVMRSEFGDPLFMKTAEYANQELDVFDNAVAKAKAEKQAAEKAAADAKKQAEWDAFQKAQAEKRAQRAKEAGIDVVLEMIACAQQVKLNPAVYDDKGGLVKDEARYEVVVPRDVTMELVDFGNGFKINGQLSDKERDPAYFTSDDTVLTLVNDVMEDMDIPSEFARDIEYAFIRRLYELRAEAERKAQEEEQAKLKAEAERQAQEKKKKIESAKQVMQAAIDKDKLAVAQKANMIAANKQDTL